MSGLVVEEHTCRSDQMSHHAPAVPSSVISHTSPGWSYRHHFTCHLCPDVTRLYFAYPAHSFPFCRHKTTNTIIWSLTKIQHQKFGFANKLFLIRFFLSRLQSMQLFEFFSPNLRVLSCLQIHFKKGKNLAKAKYQLFKNEPSGKRAIVKTIRCDSWTNSDITKTK